MARHYHKRRKHKHHKRHISHRPRKKRSAFYGFRRFILRNPLVSAIGSIVISIILIRAFFSNNLFGNDVTEFRLWYLFFATLIGIIGIAALYVWFKRNVPQLFTKHDVNLKN